MRVYFIIKTKQLIFHFFIFFSFKKEPVRENQRLLKKLSDKRAKEGAKSAATNCT
jgi:hypothetical protein